jgi:hypothetical protein
MGGCAKTAANFCGGLDISAYGATQKPPWFPTAEMSLSAFILGDDDFTTLLFNLFDVPQQNIFDVVGHGTVLAGCENADLVENLVRQTEGENALCGSHSIIPLQLF